MSYESKKRFNMPWPTQNPIIQWLKADSIVQLPALLSAVLAILMAMGAAVGMQIMVGDVISPKQHINELTCQVRGAN